MWADAAAERLTALAPLLRRQASPSHGVPHLGYHPPSLEGSPCQLHNGLTPVAQQYVTQGYLIRVTKEVPVSSVYHFLILSSIYREFGTKIQN